MRDEAVPTFIDGLGSGPPSSRPFSPVPRTEDQRYAITTNSVCAP